MDQKVGQGVADTRASSETDVERGEQDMSSKIEKEQDSPAPPTAAPAGLDWDGPDDPDNPHNWAIWKRVFNTAATGLLAFVA